MRKRVKNFSMKHVELGCLSDPKTFPMYHIVTEREDGLPCYRTIRGTSSVEGYHSKYRKLFSAATSPKLSHSMLLLYNFKWNISRAGVYRGLHKRFTTGFMNHYLIDLIQLRTQGWYPTPLHRSWSNTFCYKDNGERTGLLSSDMIGTNNDVITGEYSLDPIDHALQVRKPSEKIVFVDVRPLNTSKKKNYFATELHRFINKDDGSFQLDRMTTSWNDHIASLEEKLEPAALAATNLFRKNRALLQKYFNEYNQWYNMKETMS